MGAANWTPTSPGASPPQVWLDAADASTLSMDPSSPGHVLGWRDKGLQGDNASADPATAPTLNSLNGLATVDFGPFVFGSGAGLHMSMAAASPVATVFIVWGSANGGGFALTQSGAYWFHRSQPGTGQYASDPIYDATVPWSDASLRTGDADTRLNGSLIDPTSNGLSGDWDIVATRISSGNSLQFDTLANDRGIRTGGQGIAELLTFSTRLGVTETQRIEGYLAWKWGLQGKLAAGHPYKSHAPVVGPMAQYHLEDGGYSGAAGEVRDSSGANLHGSAIGNTLPVAVSSVPAISGSPGTCGNALFRNVNGSGALAVNGLPVRTEAGAQTSVSFWMYWDGTDQVIPLGWQQQPLFFNTGRFGFDTFGGSIYGTSSAGLANGWHHIVAVFTNGNYGANQLYIDGANQTLAVYFNTPNNNETYVSAALYIGGWGSNTGNRFSGRLDEVQVFDGALTQSEIGALYAQTHTCASSAPATLLAEYRFEDSAWTGAAGEVKDSSGNARNATGAGSTLPALVTAGAPALAGASGTCSYGAFYGPFDGGGTVAVTGLPVSQTAGDKTSVAFWMYWNGADAGMPIATGLESLWIVSGAIGFESGNGDVFGIASAGLANGWHHIVAVFTNNNVFDNRLFVDGIEQALTQRYSSPFNANAVAASNFTIGGAAQDSRFRFVGALDEFRFYRGGLTSMQVAAIMNARHACGVAASPLGRFNVFETATAAGAVVGSVHTKVAASPFVLDVVAIDEARTGALSSFTGDVKVDWLDASDNSGSFDSGGCRSSWVPIASNAGNSITLAGSDAGRKSVGLVESNAWRDIRLRISTPATGTPSAVACSSDDFANRPAAFTALAATDADSTSLGSARSLANVSASGGNVHKAGRPFTLSATAVNAASAVTSGYTGTPTGVPSLCSGSACITGSWTRIAGEGEGFSFTGTRPVRYGNSSGWATLNLTGGGVCDNATFGDPTPGVGKECQLGGSGGVLAVTLSAAAGLIGGSATYSEAGSVGLQLVDSTFAGVDASDGSSESERTIASAVQNVGRFVPDHFDIVSLASPTLRTFDSSSCAARSFTYLGQPFGYATTAQASVVARNAAGATTTYYAGALWKLDGASVAQGYNPTPATPGLDVSAIGAPTLTSNGNGSGLLVGASADKLAFVRPGNAPVAPFNANIALSWDATDSSEAAVSGNGSIATPTPLVFPNIAFDAGSQMRFGMLRMTPAYGSELVNLPVLVEAQYWDGHRMATNAADQCTTLAPGAVAMGNYQRSLAACKTALGSDPITLASGRGYLRLAKPGAGNAGSVDLSLQIGATAAGQTCSTVGGSTASAGSAALPWLQGRWGNAAAFDQNPSTRASFGQYRSPLIYQREMY